MYKSFFKLQRSPFGASPDPHFLYMMPHTREALAGLEYSISARKGVTVLTGEVGTGKTTLLRSTIEKLNKQRIFTAFVFNPRFEVLDFLEFVLCDFGLIPTSRTKSGMLLQLNRWLVECYRHQETCVILIDEAQNCSWELLEEIRLLTNLETASEKLVQIILSGQPELEQRLKQNDTRQLRQRVSLWCRTYPLNAEETSHYIKERLAIAGSEEEIFPPAAVALIYQASGGIPRLINLVCEHCLILGYVEEQRTIFPAMVLAVIKDLDLEPEAEPMAGVSGALSREETADGATLKPALVPASPPSQTGERIAEGKAR